MQDIKGTLSHFSNPRANIKNSYSDEQKQIMDVARTDGAMREISLWPGYQITPLLNLSALAENAGFANIWYKDESKRFALKSFKALGGAYAVGRQLQNILEEKTGSRPSIKALLEGQFKSEISTLQVSCATDGNHGRSIAWGAQMFGCGCVIYIHSGVSEGRKEAIEAFNATVIRIDGNYDESVRLADSEAAIHKRIIVSDTSYEGYMEVPKDVALGYTVMLAELVTQLRGEIPTHVFIQAGVGGLASAVCGYFWSLWGEQRPRCVIVEPEQANCLQESARAGKPVIIKGELKTLMAGLACGEVSALAWQILENGADDFMTVSEDTIPDVMRLLAKGYQTDPAIEAGESAVPGLAAALLAARSSDFCEKLALNADSKILVLGTEGATDPELYQKLTGINPTVGH
jgi:diaminopropionate ammonia-lyase